MRIIAGRFRGRTIDAPQGLSTRPTTDRVRESLASALVSERGGLEGAVVLDAFAGSGALGFEMLSRGAAFACFCDQAASVVRVIKRNAEKLGLDPAEALVVKRNVFSQLPPKPEQSAYDLVLLDPPYKMRPPEIFGMLSRLSEEGLLAPDALVSYEHADETSAAVDGCLGTGRLASRRRFGDTVVDLLYL